MRSIDELREALTSRADALSDDALAGRPSAVRRRAVLLERRRRAVLASVAAVVLVAAGVVVARPHHDATPALVTNVKHPKTFYGSIVPEQLAVLGSPYVLTGFVTGDGSASVDLPAARPAGAPPDSGSARVVAWAVENQRDTVSIQAPIPASAYPRTAVGGEFQDFVQIGVVEPDGTPDAGEFTVSDLGGHVALAVYTEASTLRLASFPTLIDDDWVLDHAQFGGPGTSLGDSTDPLVDSRVVAACTGEDGDHVTLEVDGKQRGSTTCVAPVEIRTSSDRGVVAVDVPGSPSAAVASHVAANIAGSTARVGLADYRPLVHESFLGQPMATQLPYRGHMYRLLDEKLDRVTNGELTAPVPTSDDGRPLLMVPVLPGNDTCTVLRDNEPVGGCQDDGTMGVVASGTVRTVTLEFRDGAYLEQHGLQAGVLFYQQVD